MNSIWSEIRNDFNDEGIYMIDAWLTDDENEDGCVIAEIEHLTRNVRYVDERAKTDEYAQVIIKETLNNLQQLIDCNV